MYGEGLYRKEASYFFENKISQIDWSLDISNSHIEYKTTKEIIEKIVIKMM